MQGLPVQLVLRKRECVVGCNIIFIEHTLGPVNSTDHVVDSSVLPKLLLFCTNTKLVCSHISHHRMHKNIWRTYRSWKLHYQAEHLTSIFLRPQSPYSQPHWSVSEGPNQLFPRHGKCTHSIATTICFCIRKSPSHFPFRSVRRVVLILWIVTSNCYLFWYFKLTSSCIHENCGSSQPI